MPCHLCLLLRTIGLLQLRKPIVCVLLEFAVICILFSSVLLLKAFLPIKLIKNKPDGPQSIDFPTQEHREKTLTVGYAPASPGLDAFLRKVTGDDAPIIYKGFPSKKLLMEAHESNTGHFQLAMIFKLRSSLGAVYKMSDILGVNFRPFSYYQDHGIWHNVFVSDGCLAGKYKAKPNPVVYIMSAMMKSMLNLTHHNVTVTSEDISCVNLLYTTPFQLLLAIFIILAFLPCSLALTYDLMKDKTSKLKRSLKVVGVKGPVYRISWLIIALTRALFTSLMVTWAVFSLGWMDALPRVRLPVIFAMVSTYGLAVTTFSFCLRDLSKDLFTASIMTIVWNATQIGFLVYRLSQESKLDNQEYFYTAFFYHWVLAVGCHIIVELEKSGDGIGLHSLVYSYTSQGNLTILKCLLLLLLNAVLYFIVGPGFKLLIKLIRLDTSIGRFKKNGKGLKTKDTDLAICFQKISDPEVCIEYTNMVETKIEQTFQVLKNQTTVILGHPSSGKTRVVLAVTGLKRISGVTVKINGDTIHELRDLDLQTTGICPQQNSLIYALSVHENLYFRTKLLGYSKSIASTLVTETIRQSNLQSWAHVRAQHLPKAWINIFNVYLALINDPEIMIPDEPDYGLTDEDLDQWLQFIQLRLVDKAVLMTTSSTVTALRLANNIAVISEQSIVCFGNVSFVQTLFGTGYRLSLSLRPNCDIEALCNFIHLYIETYNVQSKGVESLDLILPESFAPLYEFLFGNLLSRTLELGVESFTLERLDMRDIFIKLNSLRTFRLHFRSMSKRISTLQLKYFWTGEIIPRKLYSTLSDTFKKHYSSSSLWSLKERESSSNWLVSSFKNMSSFLRLSSMLADNRTLERN